MNYSRFVFTLLTVILSLLPELLLCQIPWSKTNELLVPFKDGFNAIGVSPSGAVFAGGYGQGIYRSTDGGASWAGPYTSGGYGVGYIDAIGIDSFQRVFVGSNLFDRGGVYFSSDYGLTWSNVLANQVIWSVVVTGRGSVLAGTFGSGFFRSTNNGATWTQHLGGGGTALAVNPLGYVFAAAGDGIYRSTDDGQSWMLSTNKVNASVSMAADKNGWVYAVGNSKSPILRSGNSGVTWSESTRSPDGRDFFRLAVDTAGRLYASTVNSSTGDSTHLFLSLDRGQSWKFLPRQFASISSIATDPEGRVFIGTNSEILLSRDQGNSWTTAQVYLPSRIATSLSTDRFGSVFATSDKGLFRTTDRGSHWMPLLLGYSLRSVGSNSAGDIFTVQTGSSNQAAIFFHSSDGGKIWDQSVIESAYTAIYCVRVNPCNGDILLGSDGGIYRSTDSGKSWTRSPLAGSILDIGINSRGHIFAGDYFGRGVYRSTDNGATWKPITQGLDFRASNVTSLAIDSQDRVLLGTFFSGLFRSADNGETWTQTNLTNSEIVSIAINTHGVIYVSSRVPNNASQGVSSSTDGGTTWQSLGLLEEGSDAPRSLSLDTDGYLYAALNNGVYRSDRSTLTSVTRISGNDPAAFELHYNYPNPFNPTTRIHYELLRPATVLLSVFNALGQEVALLVKETKEAGYYQATWNASNVPSGVYFYRLQAGEFVDTKKMTLLR